jgi:hypothetical protein
MYESFVRYQSRLIEVFDEMSSPYGFQVINASQPSVKVFEALQTAISKMVAMEVPIKGGAVRKTRSAVVGRSRLLKANQIEGC